MRPLFCLIMCGTAARVQRNVPRRFRRRTKSQSSTFISQIFAFRLPPTLLTRMSSAAEALDGRRDQRGGRALLRHVAAPT